MGGACVHTFAAGPAAPPCAPPCRSNVVLTHTCASVRIVDLQCVMSHVHACTHVHLHSVQADLLHTSYEPVQPLHMYEYDETRPWRPVLASAHNFQRVHAYFFGAAAYG
eukprot:1147635-Pelagomonas_calceolata.AAC.8